jgi:hypothetical protein
MLLFVGSAFGEEKSHQRCGRVRYLFSACFVAAPEMPAEAGFSGVGG